jgi:predicted transcriptional regulator
MTKAMKVLPLSEAGADILESIAALKGATTAQLLEETGRDLEEVERELAALVESGRAVDNAGLWVTPSRRARRKAAKASAVKVAARVQARAAVVAAKVTPAPPHAHGRSKRWRYGDASRQVVAAMVLLTRERPASKGELVATLPSLGPKRIALCLEHSRCRGYVERVGTRQWRVTSAGERWLAEVERHPLDQALATVGRATARQLAELSGRSASGVYVWLRQQLLAGLVEVAGRELRKGIGGVIYQIAQGAR